MLGPEEVVKGKIYRLINVCIEPILDIVRWSRWVRASYAACDRAALSLVDRDRIDDVGRVQANDSLRNEAVGRWDDGVKRWTGGCFSLRIRSEVAASAKPVDTRSVS